MWHDAEVKTFSKHLELTDICQLCIKEFQKLTNWSVKLIWRSDDWKMMKVYDENQDNVVLNAAGKYQQWCCRTRFHTS